jgi:transcriptional regulator with PAS, ATPase and Fis domain
MSDQKDKKVFEIKNKNYVVSKFSLPESEFYTAVFKSEKDTIDDNKRINQEFINKGFVAKYNFEDIIGESQANRKVKKVAKKLAKTDLTILIEGESGTGKELFANAIHNSSKRKNGPFLAVNFSALPDKLIESELFGYEPGAFTGAKKSGKKGLFEQADGGSIFLDEIGDISIEVQARLLRVLQEKELMRIGGNKINKVDVRVIAATNKNLWNLIEQGKFRKDLYYRLKIGYLKLPPLRERKEDLKELMDYFIEVESTKPIKIAQEVFEELKKYDWYGNIRELKNTLNYMLAVREGDKITLSDIPNRDFFKGEIVIEKDRFNQNLKLSEEEKFLIKMIDQLKQKHNVIGRRLLAEKSQNTSFPLTKYQIRNRLDKLEKKGLVEKGKGKKGTQLTILGKEYLDQ